MRVTAFFEIIGFRLRHVSSTRKMQIVATVTGLANKNEEKNMSSQKKRREREKRMQYYYKNKASCTPYTDSSTPQKKTTTPRLTSLLRVVIRTVKKIKIKIGHV